MIELRWLERVVGFGGDGLSTREKTERVLQYRQMDPQHGYHFWTEWTDVPTVREA